MEHSENALKLAQILNELGGKNIEILDVSKKTMQVKFIIISSSPSDEKLKELALSFMGAAAELGFELIHKDGLTKAQWIVLDYRDYLVELFIQPLREKYNLEKLWKDGKNIIKLQPEKVKTSRRKTK